MSLFRTVVNTIGGLRHRGETLAAAGRLTPITPPEILSRDAVVGYIRLGAARLGVKPEDLISAHRAGTLQNPGEVADLLILADALPENDPLICPPPTSATS